MLINNCKKCSEYFEVTDSDLNFYKKVSPEFNGKIYLFAPPTLCPLCREQCRWAFRNQNKLYKRKCDFSGQSMISLYSADKLYKVYKEEIWWSDKWDVLAYGRDFDFSRPFFEQFSELLHEVPRRGMHQDGTNENCNYITFGMNNKNCYYSFACFYCENTYYSTLCGKSRDCCDSFFILDGELLYECMDCKACYNCNFCRDCINCTDCTLMDDCRDCANCIACKNLRKKQYHIYNRPVSKDEFGNFKKNLKNNFVNEKNKFNEWKLQLPFIATHITHSENCTGDYIEHGKNCIVCFDAPQGAEDCKYCQWSGAGAKNLMDCSMAGFNCEILYEMTATAFAHTCAFTNFCRNCNDVYYCDCVSSCKFCFGCIGLNHKEYCVFNKQYSKDEYEKLVPRIIEHMQETGEWGEFFPMEISPFRYEETVAADYFPAF